MISWLSLAFMCVEAVVGVYAGVAASSIALIGSGIDTIVGLRPRARYVSAALAVRPKTLAVPTYAGRLGLRLVAKVGFVRCANRGFELVEELAGDRKHLFARLVVHPRSVATPRYESSPSECRKVL